MDNKNKPTTETNPVDSWNGLRAELEKTNDRFTTIIDRFENNLKREHAMSSLEFQSQTLEAFNCISKGFNTILALTNIEPSVQTRKIGPGSERVEEHEPRAAVGL